MRRSDGKMFSFSVRDRTGASNRMVAGKPATGIIPMALARFAIYEAGFVPCRCQRQYFCEAMQLHFDGARPTWPQS